MERPDHDAACPCKDCIGFDIQYAIQEGLRAEHWQPGGLQNYLQVQRSRQLNWALSPGHCLLCGGTSINSWLIGEHYELHRFNEVEQSGRFFSSLLIHKQGPMIAVYKHYLQKSGPFKTGDAKKLLIKWASNMMDLNPTYAFGVASRDIGEWLEIRIGYTQLVEETREDRIGRTG